MIKQVTTVGTWATVGASVKHASQLSHPVDDGAGVFTYHLPLIIVRGLLLVGAGVLNSLAPPSCRACEQKWIPTTRESRQANESRCWLVEVGPGW